MSLSLHRVTADDLGPRALYSPREVERILGVSHATLYRLAAARQLDLRKIGNKTVITAESIAAFIASLPSAQLRDTGGPKKSQ